jgi:hypothetical protein
MLNKLVMHTGKNVGMALWTAMCLLLFAGLVYTEPSGQAGREIPKTWDEAALATLEVPLADPAASPVHIPAEYYYKITVRGVFKSYPVYAPGHEPAGYLERLGQLDPELAFDPSKLATEEDWIAAGELVFDAPIAYDALVKVADVRDPAWYQRTGVPVAKDGTVPFFRYVLREKGKVELGQFSCGICHTRVMPDGAVIKGAQGNFPLDRMDGQFLRARAANAENAAALLERVRQRTRGPYGAPWLGAQDPEKRDLVRTLDEIAASQEAIPPGVQARFGASVFHPVQVPDLIGLRDRAFLDRTGHVKHRSIGDLMRYAALQQGMAFYDRYGSFVPSELPADPGALRRYSDEMLYALGLYLYSLEPPPNPHPFDELAARGKAVFDREGCEHCHKPPLYSNNKLVPVAEYRPPAGFVHPQSKEIIPFPIGTDPGLALYTRRGTGLYKIPSLRGVWYRGPFEHSGSVATLEDWFDPRRVRDDYVPTGFRGAGVKTRAVKGHPFGLELSVDDRKALIAFLKTL